MINEIWWQPGTVTQGNELSWSSVTHRHHQTVGAVGWRSSTRGKGLRLCQERFKLDMRGNFFTEKAAEPWNGLPREMVQSPPLGVLEMCRCGDRG